MDTFDKTDAIGSRLERAAECLKWSVTHSYGSPVDFYGDIALTTKECVEFAEYYPFTFQSIRAAFKVKHSDDCEEVTLLTQTGAKGRRADILRFVRKQLDVSRAECSDAVLLKITKGTGAYQQAAFIIAMRHFSATFLKAAKKDGKNITKAFAKLHKRSGKSKGGK